MLLIILHSYVDKSPNVLYALDLISTFSLDAQGSTNSHVPCFPIDLLPKVSKTLFNAPRFPYETKKYFLFNFNTRKLIYKTFRAMYSQI